MQTPPAHMEEIVFRSKYLQEIRILIYATIDETNRLNGVRRGSRGSNKSIHQLQLQLAMQDCWRKTKGIFVSMHFVCGFSATVVHQVVDTPHSNSPVMPHIFSGAQQTIYVYIWHIAHLSSAAPKFPHAVRCKRENQQPHF